MGAPMPRYLVVEGSQSGHCCFEATVVDTRKPSLIGGQFEQLCECFEAQDAILIASSLNAKASLEPTGHPED